MAVDVGRVKKIIPALKGTPVTQNNFKRKNPMTGRISIFKIDAIKEIFVLCLSPVSVNEPPMDIRAKGMVTEVMRLKVLSMKTGKKACDLEKRIPAIHPRIKGLEINAFKRTLRFCPELLFSPEYQINVETASTLIMGMANPMRMPKYLIPDSPRTFMTMAIPM